MFDHSDPQDTIAAMGTASGEGAISIIRVSGPRAFEVADRVFRCRPPLPSARPGGSFVHGLVHAGGRPVDEALLLIMRAPHSYTREHMVEIQGHGGAHCARSVLRCVLEAGARQANPGEFTQRAFLNGRLDLLQAEAVLDLIRAGSERAAAAALEQMNGSLSRRTGALYESLLHTLSDIEACLDFPEEDIPSEVLRSAPERIQRIGADLDRLLALWDEGHLLREGAVTVISGSPNAGKSTLMNVLLGRERAIVSPQPGTTRDSIEETLLLEGWTLRLVDTAGLRDSSCEIEREGVRRARSLMQRADLHLHLVDASQAVGASAAPLLPDLPRERTIIVLNKIDLPVRTAAKDLPEGFTVVRTSLTANRGLNELRRAMVDKITRSVDLAAPPHAVISERHRRLLLTAGEELRSAAEQLQKNGEENLVTAAIHLRAALEQVGRLEGRDASGDLLQSVFSRFCIGK